MNKKSYIYLGNNVLYYITYKSYGSHNYVTEHDLKDKIYEIKQLTGLVPIVRDIYQLSDYRHKDKIYFISLL